MQSVHLQNYVAKEYLNAYFCDDIKPSSHIEPVSNKAHNLW